MIFTIMKMLYNKQKFLNKNKPYSFIYYFELFQTATDICRFMTHESLCNPDLIDFTADGNTIVILERLSPMSDVYRAILYWKEEGSSLFQFAHQLPLPSFGETINKVKFIDKIETNNYFKHHLSIHGSKEVDNKTGLYKKSSIYVIIIDHNNKLTNGSFIRYESCNLSVDDENILYTSKSGRDYKISEYLLPMTFNKSAYVVISKTEDNLPTEEDSFEIYDILKFYFPDHEYNASIPKFFTINQYYNATCN